MFSTPMIGVGGGIAANAIMWLWGTMAGNIQEAWDDHGKKVVKTMSPSAAFPIIEETVEPAIEYIEEEF